jgi:mannitol-1-phosphate/altronate dehydrogenase
VIVAAWCRYLELAGTPGYNFEIQDKMGVVLQDNARASITSDPLAFLKIETVFDDLAHSRRFVDTYLLIIDSFRKYGVEQTIRKLEQLVI